MNYIIMIEFILNSISIAAFTLRLLMMQESIDIKIFLITVCCTQIVYLFLIAWHANELKVQSVMISDALFESEWYEKSTSAKKTIAIIMTRSQKPLTIFVGPFFPMTIDTAIAVRNVL
ncbi:odorant receptor 49b-like [Anthonomus grandis grandis]|uniref:odorant receptor 49b-like n=1 Tax=Anthonomus grandis grandis TaxID=2921223 RepID=UPI00216522F7|nr:odorant receptor 49b-like [Anthonomus grandis grandis]